jgi:hypothetical protein
MIDQKQQENVEYSNCFGSMITNDERQSTWEIKSWIIMAFNKKKTLCTSRTDLN